MKNLTKEVITFCSCGMALINGRCKRCQDKTVEWGDREMARRKIGKYSGKSNSPHAFGDYK